MSSFEESVLRLPTTLLLPDSAPNLSTKLIIDGKGTEKDVSSLKKENEQLDQRVRLALTTLETTLVNSQLSTQEQLDYLQRMTEQIPVQASSETSISRIQARDIFQTINGGFTGLGKREIDQTKLNTESAEKSKEELAQQIADSAKFLLLLGKIDALVGQRARGQSSTGDFENLYYVRKPSDTQQAGDFIVDTSEHPLKQVTFFDLSSPHLIQKNGNQYAEVDPGEVTVRHQKIEYEDGTAGVLLMVSVIFTRSTVDPDRWIKRPSYVCFDLPADEAQLFLRESLKDPSFVKKVLVKITAQSPRVMGSLPVPRTVICATAPGANALKLNLKKVTISHQRMAADDYIGSFVISDGQTVRTQNSAVAVNLAITPETELPSLVALGVDLSSSQALKVDRQKVDAETMEKNTIPPELQQRVENISGLKEFYNVVQSVPEGKLALIDELRKSYYKVISRLGGRRFEIDKKGIKALVDEEIVALPEAFDLRRKLRPDLEKMMENYAVLIKKPLPFEVMVTALKELATLENHLVFGASAAEPFEPQKILDTINRLLSLKDATAAVDTLYDKNNGITSELQTSINLDTIIYEHLYGRWNPFQKFWARRAMKKFKP